MQTESEHARDRLVKVIDVANKFLVGFNVGLAVVQVLIAVGAVRL